MDNENLQNFLDEYEIMLHGIRGGVLVFAQDTNVRSALEIPLRRVMSLHGSAAKLELAEIGSAAGELEERIRAASEPGFAVSNDQVRDILDRISKVESLLAAIRMSEASFAQGLSELVDNSFEDMGPAMQAVSDGPDLIEFEEQDGFEIDAELLEVFALEADDLLKNIEASLQQLVLSPDDKEALWEVRRSAHTFKGSAGIVGLKRPSELAHRIEDLLDHMVEVGRGGTDEIIGLLLRANESLKAMAAGESSPSLDSAVTALYADFDRALVSINEPEAPAGSAPTRATASAEPSKEDERPQRPAETRSIVRVSLDRLDELVGIIRDLVVSRSVFEQQLAEFDRQIDDLHNATRRLQSTNSRLEVDFEAALLETDRGLGTNIPAATKPREAGVDREVDQFDSLEFDRYTEFHQVVRELSETSSDTFAINTSLESLKEDLESLFDHQRRLIDAIQEKVMRIRLVAFGTLKTRLDRAVRVTCDEEGKQADVVLENGHIEVDTQIIDSMIEPLLHLLKNAVVHGIEFPEMRRLLGKPETGTIRVRLANEDTHVVLTVSDDGSGIATSALKEKAVTSGVMTRAAVDAMTDEQACGLIFLPGLTTAQKLNLNAGRGVGMNIVKESIESKKGSIAIESTPHEGTTFTVRLPLPLAVTNALIVRSGNHTFAVPLKSVKQMVEIEPQEIARNGAELFYRNGIEPIPLRHIDELVQQPARIDTSTAVPAFLIETVDGTFAVGVEQVVRSEELVIKPLGKPLDSFGGLLGASILGNGQLVPILDVHYLLADRPETVEVSETAAKKPDVVTVMIVDDSPSVRLMTSKVIKGAGWVPLTAKDGVDALEILASAAERPSVILSDIEMPRMGGYELVAELKKNDELKHIPVIVITSRAGDKHREKAFETGVSEYLVKPYSEWELIQKIQVLAGGK